MGEQTVEVSRESIESLARKIDEFGRGLTAEERALFAAVVAAGTQSVASEVAGFAARPRPAPSGPSIGGFFLAGLIPRDTSVVTEKLVVTYETMEVE